MNNIPNIPFQSNHEMLGFEFFKVSQLFSRKGEKSDHSPTKPHRLSFFALLIVTEGAGVHEIDLKKYTFQKGAVLKIAKGQVHAFQESINYDGFLVVFTEDFVLKYFSKSSIAFISHLYNYHISAPIVEKSTFNTRFIELLTEEFENKNTYVQTNIVAKMLELYLLKLERLSHNTVSTNLNKEYYTRFYEFKNLVETNYRKTRNVKDYAERMSVSTKHLNKIVQSFTLNSAKYFVDQYVVLEIKRSLLSTNQSIKEIAFESGFDEVTNFTKFFKKHTEQSPKKYKSSL